MMSMTNLETATENSWRRLEEADRLDRLSELGQHYACCGQPVVGQHDPGCQNHEVE
jgi:hypothetical protein